MISGNLSLPVQRGFLSRDSCSIADAYGAEIKNEKKKFLVNSRKVFMSSLKAKLLLLLKSIRFKGLQRFGTQFSKHRDFRSIVYRRKKCVSFLYSTQELLHPSHQLIAHLFFICNTKISFTLLHNKSRKAHHSHAGL